MDYELARHQMVEQQVRSYDVLDDAVLAVMHGMGREQFVPPEWRDVAYADAGVPIGHGQRTFSPKIDGRILQAVAVNDGDRVLEIGSGSGYLSACMARLGGSVVALERVEALAGAARESLAAAGIGNVEVRHAEAPQGLPAGRFHVVVAGGAVAGDIAVFEKLLEIGGRLFVVQGDGPAMSAMLVQRATEDRWYVEDLFETVMPHLVGFEPVPGFEF